ncbi:MAG TPA: rhodanese-like domain-containing protein [Thermomicrobiales bacterium]|nr:rhodanese-like domain-containing protein [Thermomicrobiales bacterium]
MVLRKWLGGGIQIPQRSVTAVADSMRQRAVQVIDVREHDEWRAGHIEGAIHIPLGALASRMATLDRDIPVITVCRSGRRSMAAATALKRAGFSDVANMEGGMLAWARLGFYVNR